MALYESSVLYSTSPQGITTITLNRPRVRNAVNAVTAQHLAAAFRAFENNDTQKVCILTGAGGTFCAGYDLQEVASSSSASSIQTSDPDGVIQDYIVDDDEEQEPQPVPLRTKSVQSTRPNDPNTGPMGPSRMMLSKPVIAAVSGHAVAGGLEISLLADLRVCDDTAIFGVFSRRFGVPLIDGGTVRLPKIVGLGRAMDMILSGRAVDANEALAMGLVNKVVQKGKALEAAVEIATGLLAFPQLCMNTDRKSAYHGAFDAQSLSEALGFEFNGGLKVIEGESVNGARRFTRGEGKHGSFKSVKSKL